MGTEELQKKENGIYEVLSRVISLIRAILLVPAILFLVLAAGYIAAVAGAFQDNSTVAASDIKGLILELWRTLIPIASQALSLIGPILALVVIAGLIRWVSPSEKISLKSLSENLPAILAILILGSISILPIMGYEIPSIMSNIALVVVGFYFGKLQINADKT